MQVQRKIEELLALRASEWLELLPEARESERAAFAQWLGESRLHVQEFLEVAEIEYHMRRLDSDRQYNLEQLLRTVAPNVVQLSRPPPAASGNKWRLWPRRRIFQAGGLLAACAAMVVIALVAFGSRPRDFSTSIGELKTVELDDKSVIILNAQSDIEVRMQRTAREIELRQGEALFAVAHDPDRPFEVHTRAGVIRAVGTQFNVYDRPSGETRVSVLEGRVKLSALQDEKGGQAGTAVFLRAGEEADIRPSGSIVRNPKAVVANSVSWRQRRLVFENASLVEMVTEFNRYNRALRLRLEGLQSNPFRYSGIFDATDPQSFVSLLEQEPQLDIERQEGLVVIRERK